MIENIGGAGGMIAAAKAARAEPDGYTIMIHQVALAAGMTMYPNLRASTPREGLRHHRPHQHRGVDPSRSRPSLPADDFAALLRWMKAPGQSVKIGHPGVGWFGHLGRRAGRHRNWASKVTQVPYRGAGPALVDLLSGEVDLTQNRTRQSSRAAALPLRPGEAQSERSVNRRADRA